MEGKLIVLFCVNIPFDFTYRFCQKAKKASIGTVSSFKQFDYYKAPLDMYIFEALTTMDGCKAKRNEKSELNIE